MANPFETQLVGRHNSYATFIREQVHLISLNESKMIAMSDGSSKCEKLSKSYYPGKSESSNKLVKKCRSAVRAAEIAINAKFKTKLDSDGNMWVMRAE